VLVRGFPQERDGWTDFASTLTCKTLNSVAKMQVQTMLQLIIPCRAAECHQGRGLFSKVGIQP
jgi:hypothetical protein